MTDKELRRLSRLELLELLLEASKENQQLKEQVERLTVENKTTQNIENLSVITRQVENTLRYANNITDTLKTGSADTVQTDAKASVRATDNRLSDKEIYRRILLFFANNDSKLDVFPDELGRDIRERLESLLKK